MELEVVPGHQREEVLGHQKEEEEEEVGNLRLVEVVGVAGVEVLLLLLRLLCWVTGQEAVGNPWSAGWMAAGEEAGYGRRVSRKRALRTGVRGSEKVKSAPVEVAVADRLCLTEEVGVACLHVLEAAEEAGCLAMTGPGSEAEGQSGLAEVEGLVQRDWSLAQEAEALVCQVEVVDVQRLLCSPPFSPPPCLQTAR